jgi:hypothetical protein
MDRIKAAYTGGQLGDDGKEDPRARELRLDREKAQQDLAGRFQVLKDGEKGTGLPNQVTKEQYDKICNQYSDIRMGESNIKINTDGMGPEQKKKFMDGSMNDIASMMQTKAGRDLVGQLGSAKDENGRPRLTTLNNTTNPEAACADSSRPENRDKRHDGNGTDMKVKYAPGQDVKMADSSSPWLPMRSDVVLFHEMTHALHGVQGVAPNTNQAPADAAHRLDKHDQVQGDEYPTVGLGKYANDPITENAYRAERRALADQPGARAGDGTAAMQPRTSYTPDLSEEKKAEVRALIAAQRAQGGGAPTS